MEVYHSLLGTGRFGISGIESLFSSWILVAFRMEIYDGYLTGWQFPLMLILGAAAWYRAARRQGRFLLPLLWMALAHWLSDPQASPADARWLQLSDYMVLGVLLILCVMYLPNGLATLWQRRKPAAVEAHHG